MVHEQKFKDLLSSTCQVSVESRMLDLELEVLTGITFSYWNFSFSHSKASDANIGIIANFAELGETSST